MKHVDVIICGLGPTGAILAGLLGQRGVQVAAFDKLPDLYPTPRAIVFDHEAMRVVQELGIADRVRRHTASYRPTEYRGARGQVIRRFDASPPPYRLGWEPSCVFDQPSFEREVRARLEEIANVAATWPAEVTSFKEDDEGVTVEVKTPDGMVSSYRAAYLVACDGGSSPIRKQLGIELHDLGFEEPWIVIDVDVDERKLPDLPQTLVQYCDPQRPATFIVGPGNHRRWEIMMSPGDRFSENLTDDELWPLLDRWIKPGEGRLRRAAAYRFHGLVAKQWRRGRVLLAGDSAHMTPPFLGQGMVQGIRDAQNLGWKLARVIQGESPDGLLDCYGVERRPHVEHTTQVAIELGRQICERDPEKARVRDASLLAEQGGEPRTVVRQSLIPGLEQGLIAGDTPGAGETFPQPWVSFKGAEARLLDDITGPVFLVVTTMVLDEAQQRELTGILASERGRLVCLGAAEKQRDDAVLCLEEVTPVIQPWLAGLDRWIAIVRPDHYVFGTASTVEETVALLQRLRAGLSLRDEVPVA